MMGEVYGALLKDMDALKAVIRKQSNAIHQREKQELKGKIDVLIKIQEELVLENNELKKALDNCETATIEALNKSIKEVFNNALKNECNRLENIINRTPVEYFIQEEE